MRHVCFRREMGCSADALAMATGNESLPLIAWRRARLLSIIRTEPRTGSQQAAKLTAVRSEHGLLALCLEL